MKLYYNKFTRATRPRWLLEELGVPYELVVVDMQGGQHKSAEHMAIHPLGKVPALEDEGQVLIESVAICQYLADKFSEKGLGPTRSDAAAYYTWTIYAQVTLEPEIFRYFRSSNARFGTPDPEVAAAAKLEFHKLSQLLEKHFEKNTFVCGERFSAADVVVGSNLAWARGMGLLEALPACDAYTQRLMARPAFLAGRS